jgi:2-dehydropantoate 2-reductase
MKICIFGAGAIGGFTANLLARAGHDVSVVARGVQLHAIRDRGLTLEFQDTRETVAVAASDDPAALGPQDAVFLSVKATALGEVVPRLGPLLGPETAVITAQNGIPWWFFDGFGPRAGLRLKATDPDGAIAAALPPERIVGCVLHIGCTVVEPGVVVHSNQNGFLMGEPSGASTPRLGALVEAFTAAGIGAEAVANIQQHYWTKLLGNMSFAPVSLLTGATNDQIAHDPSIRAVCARMIEEVNAVGAAYDLVPGMDTGRRIDLGGNLVGFKTSMRQDFERGRPVELDAIVAAPMEMGDVAGVETPTVDAVYALAAQAARLAGLYR